MIDYGAGLYAQLNQSSLTSLLGLVSHGVPALLECRAIPPKVDAHPIVNYYRTSPIDGGSELDIQNWTVNFRADKEETAQQIALLGYALLARTSSSDSGNEFFFIPSILASIPPADVHDLWNVPVDVIIKARKV